MSTKLKTGIIGLGILGNQYLDFFKQHPLVELTALCDVRQLVAATLAASIGASAYESFSAMLREQRLDLVVVATPDHLHREPSLAALTAGVPTIIQEKPLATTWEDAEAIYEAVERGSSRLFVNYANRAMPLDLATYYVVQKGLIGQPIYAESRLDDNISVPTQLWGSRSREFATGSSTAHFLLSHVVDIMHWTFAPARVIEVYAISQQEVLGYTADLYDAFLTFDSGLKVRVKAEWIKHMDQIVEYYTSISGAQGSIFFNKLPGFGVQESWRANFSNNISWDELQQHQETLGAQAIHLRASRHFRPKNDEYDVSTVTGSLEHSGQTGGNGLMLIKPMLDAITENSLTPSSWQQRGPLPTHIDGLRQVRVVQAIIESAKSGRPVPVDA
jgi:predicted dehydrogenase